MTQQQGYTMVHRWHLHLALLSLLIPGCVGQCNFKGTKDMSIQYMIERVIYSPGYPDYYPDLANCTWRLHTSLVDYRIKLTVDWMDIEHHKDCQYDSLSIYNGRSSYYPLLARLCGDQYGVHYSSGRDLFLDFSSDFSNSGRGFKLFITAVPRWQVPFITSTPSWRDSTTTQTEAPSGSLFGSHLNTAALIGGITGGLCLLLFFCLLCRFYCSRQASAARHPPPPSYPSITPSAPPPGATIYQNNNAVFMMSGPGATNMGFSPCGEAPPAYFAIQQGGGGGLGGPFAAAAGPPPPSYTEAMRFSHPPAVAPATSSHPLQIRSTYPFAPPGGPPPPAPSSIPPAPCRPAPPPPPRRPPPFTPVESTGTLATQAPPTLPPIANPPLPNIAEIPPSLNHPALPIIAEAPPTAQQTMPTSAQAPPLHVSLSEPSSSQTGVAQPHFI